MVAALRSIECYCKSCFESKEVDKILRLIEPSDGLLYPGSNLYYHRKCEFGLHLGVLPRLPILSIDFGGVIDTIAYNKKNIERSFDLQLEYQALLEQLYQAFQTQDIVAIGAIATKSAILNQEFHYKKELLFCIDLAKKHNAYGIVNTHSGTCLGFLLDASLDSLGAITADLLQSFPDKNLSLYYTQ
jgi:L-threonine kinase